MRSTLFSLVDTPDLRTLPRDWPGLESVWVGAGPRPEPLHRMLVVMASAVKMKLVPSLTPLAGFFHRMKRAFVWGEHRGGMYVRLAGLKDGETVDRSWHLIAEGDDGPFIPSMAAAAIVRRMLDGRSPAPGARAATAELELPDLEPLFAARAISTGCREESGATRALPLYRRVLGEAWGDLPPAVRQAHAARGPARMAGRAKVERGASLAARLIGLVMGFPHAGEDVPLTVAFDPVPGGERWTRKFGDRSFSSVQAEGQGRWAGLIRERFGPLVFGLAPVVEKGRLALHVRRWSAFGLVLPTSLSARGPAFEEERDGVFRFSVEIGHPLAGLIVRYQGWLAPA